jgi:hypothetical protein
MVVSKAVSLTPEGGETRVAQGVSPVVSYKPRRGDTSTNYVLGQYAHVEYCIIPTLMCAAPTGLVNYRIIAYHRAYALGYICITPFGG